MQRRDGPRSGGDHVEAAGQSKGQYDRTIAVTQTSVFLGMKAAVSLLKDSAHASMINISSIFGASGGFGTSPEYHAAKGAIRIPTKNAALHWVDSGIRVNSVHPGFIDTPILDSASGTEIETAMIQLTPTGRFGRPGSPPRSRTSRATTHRSSLGRSHTWTAATWPAGRRHCDRRTPGHSTH